MAGPAGRHTRIFGAVLAALLLALAAGNLVLDPFRAYRLVAIDALRPYRDKLVSRIAKAEILVRDDCRLVILGSSRAQIALDPEHPAWGTPACNLALTGVAAPELVLVFERVLGDPRVREIVLAVDFLSFAKAAAVSDEFAHSRFNAQLQLFEYHAGLLLGEDATRASLRLVSDYRQGRKAPYTELGLTDPSRRGRPADRESFLWALERTVQGLAVPRPDGFRYDPEQVARLAAEIRSARARGIAVTVLILPSHAIYLETLRRRGLWPDYERWRSDLVGVLGPEATEPLAPLWDFTSYAGAAAEAVPAAGAAQEMRWHWDAVHVKRALGDEVIAEIRSGETPAALVPGTRLSMDSLRALDERLSAERLDYLEAHGSDLALIDEAGRAR